MARLDIELALLVDELIDAHEDTLRLAAGTAPEWRWDAHLCYLRELGRLGREALAGVAADEPRRHALPSACSKRSRRPGLRPGATGRRRCGRHGHGEGPA